MNKTASRLVVDIPPYRSSFVRLVIEVVFLAILNILVLLIFFGLFFLFAPNNTYESFICLGIAGFFWVRLLMYYLFKNMGTEELEIDREIFWLRWKLLGVVGHHVQGSTKNVLCSCDVNGCALIEELELHRFGANLTRAEKKWLVAELNNFLGKPLYK